MVCCVEVFKVLLRHTLLKKFSASLCQVIFRFWNEKLAMISVRINLDFCVTVLTVFEEE